MILDMGGFFDESDTTCSTFGLIPKRPSCRFDKCLGSFEALGPAAVLALHNKMALIKAIMVPNRTRAMMACITLVDKSEDNQKVLEITSGMQHLKKFRRQKR